MKRNAFGLVALVTVVGCGAKSGEVTGQLPDAGQAACSDGGRWTDATKFELEPSAPNGARECTPHCGPNKSASGMWPVGTLTSEALPFGACSPLGDTCTMRAEWLGPPCPSG